MSYTPVSRLLAALAVATFAVPALAGEHEHVRGRAAASGEVLLKLTGDADLPGLGRHGDADELEPVGRSGALRLHSRSKSAAKLLEELSLRGDVEYVEPNYIITASATPTDPSFGQLWGLDNTGQVINGIAGVPGAHISAQSAWDVTTGSASVAVGIIDTGVDYTHPDLAANSWSAPTSYTVTLSGRNYTCAAGTRGFNAILNKCDPKDDNNHGTHVAGTIGASANNGIGVAGVNWTTKIIGCKFLDRRGSGTTSNAVKCIDYFVQIKNAAALGANVRVLNNSWGGGGFSQTLFNAIVSANTNDMLFVAAAGNASNDNDATASYPASYAVDNVVAVAATDNRDGIASFSNYGQTSVDLGAPGVAILSTVKGGGYLSFNGTSMATPHVAGAAALVLAVCPLSTSNLKANLLAGVDPVPSLTTKTITGGRLNVDRSIRACLAP